MSIDQLITELDRNPRDPQAIRNCAQQGLQDYIGVAEAYVSLMGTVLHQPEKVTLIGKILTEITQNIQGLNQLNHYLMGDSPDTSSLDTFTGQVLRGEQTIDSLISEFEALEQRTS